MEICDGGVAAGDGVRRRAQTQCVGASPCPFQQRQNEFQRFRRVDVRQCDNHAVENAVCAAGQEFPELREAVVRPFISFIRLSVYVGYDKAIRAFVFEFRHVLFRVDVEFADEAGLSVRAAEPCEKHGGLVWFGSAVR